MSDLARTADMYCRGLGLRRHPRRPTPTVEDLVVFYLSSESEWRAACASMLAAGFVPVTAFNPYWDVRGRTCQDHDGYRIVLQREEWSNWK